MLRFFHSADWHVGEYSGPQRQGVSIRELNLQRILEEFVKRVEQERPSAVLLPGDVFKVRRPSYGHMMYMISLIRRITAVCPLIVIPGNHDQLGDGRPGIWDLIAQMDIPNLIYLGPGPAYANLTLGGESVSVYGIPYPQRHWLPAAEQRGKNLREINEALVAHVMDGIKLWAVYAPGDYKVALIHASVTGARMPSGSLLLADGEPVLPAEELLGLGLNYIALGHIHQPQEISQTMAYSGAPERFDFGDEGWDRGFRDVLIGQNATSGIRVPLPAMYFKTVNLSASRPVQTAEEFSQIANVQDAIVQIVLAGQPEEIGAVDQQALINTAMQAGALWVAGIKRRLTADRKRGHGGQVNEYTDPRTALDAWLKHNNVKDEGVSTWGSTIIEEVLSDAAG